MKDRTRIEIDLDIFERNLNAIFSKMNKKKSYLQIVKADAYGHGAYQIAKKAISLGADFLGVANPQEAILLRNQGIEQDIIILSPLFEEEIEKIIAWKITPTVFSLEFAENLNSTAVKNSTKLKVHINIDTGMGRSGISYKKALSLINRVRQLSNLEIEGVFSHFAESEELTDFSQLQITRFKNIIDKLDFTPKFIHMENSGGIVNYNLDFTNLIRIGLLSFGIYSNELLKKKIKVDNIMQYSSFISQIKYADKDTTIGYNRTFKIEKKSKYGIIPVGYADGFSYFLSNKGKVGWKNKLLPIIGKISMDMTAVDLEGLDVKVGDRVDLIANNPQELRIENIVKEYKGSCYELPCHLGRRARRFYKENGRLKDKTPLSRRDFVPTDFNDKKLSNIIQSAISERVDDQAIGSMIYSNFLHNFFVASDRDIYFRKNFVHEVEFIDNSEKEYNNSYAVKTKLIFKKILQNDYFYIICTNSSQELAKYFLRKDVEYRWLLGENVSLEENSFKITSLKVNNYKINYKFLKDNNSLKIRCQHEKLKQLKGEEVEIEIYTQTYYPKKHHQFTIYLNEITKGVKLKFIYPPSIENVESVPIFAGKIKFPTTIHEGNTISLETGKNEWVFPNSGLVISY